MTRIDFVTLKLFVAVADERRLTAAAEREHVALAAVSKRISDLEKRLGTELLYRRPRGVELTPAGDALLHHARRILADMEHLQADLSEYSRGVRGHVRLYANTSAIVQFLPADLSVFSHAHPEVKIDLEEGVSGEIVQAVRDGQTDIGIFASHIDADGLQTFPYRRDRLVLVVSAAHPLASRSTIDLAEALDEDFIGLQRDASLQLLLSEAARATGKHLRMRIQVRSFEGICRMIGFGMGVGVLPAHSVALYLRDLELATVALAHDWAHRELSIGIRDYDTLSLLSRQMVEHLAAGWPDGT